MTIWYRVDIVLVTTIIYSKQSLSNNNISWGYNGDIVSIVKLG